MSFINGCSIVQDRFIPFKKQDVIAMCLAQLKQDPKTSGAFNAFCQLLASFIHYHYHQQLEQLKNDYAPFDPNSDTREINTYTDEQKRIHRKRFANNFTQVLNAANYEQITEQDIQDALTEESLFKVRLEVAFDDFEQVVFYRRGQSQRSEVLSSIFGLKKKEINFTHYDRVAVFITFKDQAHFEEKHTHPIGFEAGSTIVKLFQNVPKADLEMLFPNSEVRMRPIDKVIIGSSAVVGGITVLVTKLGASLLLFSTLLFFWLGLREDPVELTRQHIISLAIGMGVFGSFVFKEWTKFKNRKIKFMKTLTDNLYFKNLDNNAGVFHTLIDAAEEEDFKEVIIAYTFLLNSPTGLTAQALDNKVEQWFKDDYQCELDFEISDALDKLNKMQLITTHAGVYFAKPIEEAKQLLDQQWDNIFDYANKSEVHPT